MAGVSFFEHKGKKILYEDYSESNPAELAVLLAEAKKIITGQPKNSVLALVNISRTKYDRASVAAMKEFIKENTPYIKASAIIGMEGITEVVFKGVVAFTGRKNLVVFNDADKAKDYLASLE